MSEPHCEAGTTRRRVTSGLTDAAIAAAAGIPIGGSGDTIESSSNLAEISEKAFKIPSVGPVTVTIRSAHTQQRSEHCDPDKEQETDQDTIHLIC